MKAILTGTAGSWETGNCPNVEIPVELSHLVHKYQGKDVISGSRVLASGWIWEGRSFGGCPISEYVLIRKD